MQVVIVQAGRCPQGILWSRHFRADGSCFCEVRDDEETLKAELRAVERIGRQVARQAREMLGELGEH